MTSIKLLGWIESYRKSRKSYTPIGWLNVKMTHNFDLSVNRNQFRISPNSLILKPSECRICPFQKIMSIVKIDENTITVLNGS